MTSVESLEYYMIQETTKIVFIGCVDCGITFGVPAPVLKARMVDGRMLYCPNGHPLHYVPYVPKEPPPPTPATGENVQLTQRIAELEAALDGLILWRPWVKRSVGVEVCYFCGEALQCPAIHRADCPLLAAQKAQKRREEP